MQNNEILTQIADVLEQMNKVTEALSGILNEKIVSPVEIVENGVPVVFVANSKREKKRKTIKVCEENPTIMAYMLEGSGKIEVKKCDRVEGEEYVYYQYENENGKTTYHRRKISTRENGARTFVHSTGSGDNEKHTLIYLN